MNRVLFTNESIHPTFSRFTFTFLHLILIMGIKFYGSTDLSGPSNRIQIGRYTFFSIDDEISNDRIRNSIRVVYPLSCRKYLHDIIYPNPNGSKVHRLLLVPAYGFSGEKISVVSLIDHLVF